MQFKTLAIATMAVAAVSAQSFADNDCSKCVLSSFPKDKACATLPAADIASINSVFANNTANVPLLGQLVKNPAIKGCVCNWAATVFTPTGAAAECLAGGATAVCQKADIDAATAQITPIVPLLQCGTAVAPPTGSPAPPTPTTGAGDKGTDKPADKPADGKSAGSANAPYFLTVAALGLVALAGF
ncbi:hypothetical protein BGZ94_005699 [Podila epigama]|nr:hypothetical protein BGZ94_005699 [Podila epigama]